MGWSKCSIYNFLSSALHDPFDTQVINIMPLNILIFILRNYGVSLERNYCSNYSKNSFAEFILIFLECTISYVRLEIVMMKNIFKVFEVEIACAATFD